MNGEYKNGQRNGKGKEYSNRQLIFEGDYLNGKIWNGKGFNENGEMTFEMEKGKLKIIILKDN